ncbi:TPA: hypothetical protein ACGVAX_000917 [Vibrio vulnificus]
MIILGYILFVLVFLTFSFWAPAKDFLLSSYDLAPEITVLVAIFYMYVFLVTVTFTVAKSYPSRTSFYNLHVKMACSVMVSLGLVGTFLGLVDMIAGIATALTSDEPEFSKKMAILLNAISGSLSAMSFAFVTSILGVGISAYTMVAATFVATSFKKRELEKKAEENGGTPNLETRVLDLEAYANSLRLSNVEGILDVMTPAIILDELSKDRYLNEQYRKDIFKLFNDIHNSINSIGYNINENTKYSASVLDKLSEIESCIKDSRNYSALNNGVLNSILEHKITEIKCLETLKDDMILSKSSLKELNESLSNSSKCLLDMKVEIEISKENLKNLNDKVLDNSERLLEIKDHNDNLTNKINQYKNKILNVLM